MKYLATYPNCNTIHAHYISGIGITYPTNALLSVNSPTYTRVKDQVDVDQIYYISPDTLRGRGEKSKLFSGSGR